MLFVSYLLPFFFKLLLYIATFFVTFCLVSLYFRWPCVTFWITFLFNFATCANVATSVEFCLILSHILFLFPFLCHVLMTFLFFFFCIFSFILILLLLLYWFPSGLVLLLIKCGRCFKKAFEISMWWRLKGRVERNCKPSTCLLFKRNKTWRRK